MGLGITIGVIKEEQRLIKKFSQYKDYMENVKARFIPYLI
jgi:protein-S-isoprenylcysteine O-methyltransferase Ste14